MPKPLTQRICEFCAKSYTTQVARKSVLCPNCTIDRAIIQFHVVNKNNFIIRIPEEGNHTYKPSFDRTSELLCLHNGLLIGYTSEATGIFFIGRITKVLKTSVLVRATARASKTTNETHSVPFHCVNCIFSVSKFHDEKKK